jgi:hypothetical protein
MSPPFSNSKNKQKKKQAPSKQQADISSGMCVDLEASRQIYIPEGRSLRNHRCDVLKTFIISILSYFQPQLD